MDEFLDGWVDVVDLLPWLPGEPYFVSNDRCHEMTAGLNRAGLAVIEIDLADAAGEEDLLAFVGRALSFPDYYGQNWDALRDILRQRGENAPWRMAMIFNSCDTFARGDLHSFVRSASLLREIAIDLSDISDRPYGQLELFYLGDW